MGNILDLLRDLGKSPVARNLFIKLDSIGVLVNVYSLLLNILGNNLCLLCGSYHVIFASLCLTCHIIYNSLIN